MTIKRNGDANGAPEINRFVAVLQAPTAHSFLMSQRFALEAARFWARRLHAYADQMETLAHCSNVDEFTNAQTRFVERLQRDYAEEGAAFTDLLGSAGKMEADERAEV
ncbi:phasin family protein [Terricaulis sp.]|uniref:phasin family protein n=1 Tax=Terricaulis sp. TaxID=2768686 RepID=UPI003783ABBC